MLSNLFFVQQMIKIVSVRFPTAHSLAQAKKYGDMIVAQINLMETFIDDLLNLQLLKEGKFLLDKSYFNPEETIEFIYHMFNYKMKAKGINLTKGIYKDLYMPNENLEDPTKISRTAVKGGQLPYLLLGDERRLKQVLINLIQNAYKFTREGTITIKVCYKTSLRTLVIHVQDTGAGIARSDFHRLFTRFGKLLRTADMNTRGIGLGLSIVKQIVEQSGGKISVHSDGPGNGSLFCFSMQMDF